MTPCSGRDRCYGWGRIVKLVGAASTTGRFACLVAALVDVAGAAVLVGFFVAAADAAVVVGFLAAADAAVLVGFLAAAADIAVLVALALGFAPALVGFLVAEPAFAVLLAVAGRIAAPAFAAPREAGAFGVSLAGLVTGAGAAGGTAFASDSAARNVDVGNAAFGGGTVVIRTCGGVVCVAAVPGEGERDSKAQVATATMPPKQPVKNAIRRRRDGRGVSRESHRLANDVG